MHQLLHSHQKDLEKKFDFLPFIIMFTDAEGYVLYINGQDDLLELLERGTIKVGSSIHESAIGSTAPGISLFECWPALVLGEEHYSHLFHLASCFLLPIVDHKKKYDRLPDPKKPGSERIMAFIRPTEAYEGKLTADEIIAVCKENLPAYAVPKYVEFKDDLPVTVTLKLFKKELREEAIAKMKERGEIEWRGKFFRILNRISLLRDESVTKRQSKGREEVKGFERGLFSLIVIKENCASRLGLENLPAWHSGP